MGRNDDPKGKNKATLTHGNSSRRPTTTTPPEYGALVPIPANPQLAYPFTARMRLTSSMKEAEAKLKEFKVLNPIYPDLELLENLDILDDLEEYFSTNGFGYVFAENPPFVYEIMLREFLYSFVPTWSTLPRYKSRFSIEEKHVEEWKFRLGGVDYTYSRDDLIRALRLCDRENYPYVKKETLDRFWMNISGGENEFVPSQQSTGIAQPLWRLVHRFIASCVTQRKDEGRWVTKGDLELMCCFRRRSSFDPLIIITKYLEEFKTPTFRGTYLGGGPFVTLLANDIGLFLDQQFAMPRKLLGEAEMIRRGFLKIERNRSGIQRRLVGRDVFPQHAPVPPPAAQGEAGSSSAPQPTPVNLEDLSAQLHGITAHLNTLTTFQKDSVRWAGNMFEGLYTRMGYDGYVPPPMYPYGTSYTDQGGTSAGAGDDDADDDGEDYEDEMDEDTTGSLSF